MPKSSPLVLTVLVHYNNPEECLSVVQELLAIETINQRLVVVDNQSNSENFKELKHLLSNTSADLIQNSINGGYGSGINLGVKFGNKYNPDYIQVLNTDVSLINKNYLNSLIGILENNSTIGAIGPAVQLLNGDIQNTILPQVSLISALRFKSMTPQVSKLEASPQLYTVPVINGVCMLIPYLAFKAINGFDEDFFMYGEEQDFCYRLNLAGYQIKFWSGNSIQHFEFHNATPTKALTWRDVLVRCNQLLFLLKHRTIYYPIVAFLFSLALVGKRLKNYQFTHYSLARTIYFMFRPKRLNKQLQLSQ